MYSMIDCYEVESEGKHIQLVKLRNPWGEHEWTGDWSDQSNKWTKSLREQLKVTTEDDGIFYMSFEDYIMTYETTSVCMNLTEKLPEQSFEIHGSPYAFFQFELTEKWDFSQQYLCFCVNQMGDRLGAYRRPEQRFIPCKFKIEMVNCST